MTSIGVAHERVLRANGLAAVLDAAYDAFEVMLPVIRAQRDSDDPWFLVLVMAGTAAANGRDAVLFAPSLPPSRLYPPPPGMATAGTKGGQEPTRAALVSLAGLLAGTLGQAAEGAADAGDGEACRRASGYAREIARLLVRGGP